MGARRGRYPCTEEEELTGRICEGHVSYLNRHTVHPDLRTAYRIKSGSCRFLLPSSFSLEWCEQFRSRPDLSLPHMHTNNDMHVLHLYIYVHTELSHLSMCML